MFMIDSLFLFRLLTKVYRLVVLGAVFGGWGFMKAGFNHQQYKQGFWK